MVNPNVSLFMLLGGVIVTYVEFVFPGLVVAGVAGGVVAMLGLAQLVSLGLPGWAGGVFLAGTLLLFADSRFRSRGLAQMVAGLLMFWGGANLVPGMQPALVAVAVFLFCLLTALLLRIASRARQQKWA